MRLETAIRATPSNPTAEGCPVGLTGLGRRCWARTTESCLSRALCSVSPDHHGARPHIHRWAGGPGGWRGVDGARPICVGVETARQREVAARPGTARVAGDAGAELDELAAIYEAKGVSPQTAARVVAELTAHAALASHVDAELRFDPDVLADPCRRRPRLQRRSRSDRCYPCSLFLLPPAMFRLPVTFVAVLIALGWRVRSAHVSEGAASAAPCCGW